MTASSGTGPNPAGQSAAPGSGPGPFGVLDRSIHRVALVADQLSAFICAFLIVATTIAVIIYQRGIAIAWLDDLLRMLLIWLVYLGAVPLCLDNDHISMDALYGRLPGAARRVMDVFIALLGLALCVYTAKIGYESMMQAVEWSELTPSGYIPAWPQYLAIPLGFGLMAVTYVSFLLSVLTGRRQRPVSEAERIAAETRERAERI